MNSKNILGLGAFKSPFGIWFFNGVFLKDERNLLVTKALRQMRFKVLEDINMQVFLTYTKEAIENQKLGKGIRPDRTKKETAIHTELQSVLDSDAALNNIFQALTP